MGCAYSSHNDHQRSKKKSSSTNNNNNNNANQGDDNGDLSSSSSPRTDQESTTNQRRIFDATYVSMNGHKQSGQIEITDNELIFHYGDNKHLDWPLKYIRGYGCSSNLFSFECGRKCSTGQGHHRFECTRAIQLQQQLMHQIEIMSSMLNQRNHRSLHHHHNNLSNLQQHFHSHSHLINNNDSMPSHNNNNAGRLSSSHEYQNLSNDTTLPRPGSYAENATNSSNNDNHMVIPSATTRSSSSTGVHTYLNSSVINGQMKSEPNYYSTNPISSSSSHNNSIILSNNANNNGETSSLCLNDSKYSLNDIGSSLSQINDHRSNRHNHSYDSRTLPSSMMRNNNANKNSKTLHSYVNTTTIENMINNNCDDNASMANRTRRSSNSNQNHLYLNYDHISDNNGNNLMNEINAKKLQQIQSKIDESDNLGTFCFVNFDRNVIKNRKSAIAGLKNRFNNSSNHNVNGSRIATPESYVQLDLNNKMNGGDVLSKNFNDINDDDMINNNNNNSRKCSTSSMNDYLNIDTNNLPKIARINDKFSCIVGNNINTNVNNDNNNNQMNTLERIRRNSTNNNNYITITTTTTNNNSNNNCLPQQSSTTMTSSLLSSTTAPATGTTVPYAQIDFAKTLALQASTASHRKL